ncbi:DUF6728 family protein [Salibacter sp.]|jgi:hypothetical protein|uniref:DUF6728 family protein n=1 Tax=Salibacter sp. TaxID=2010995 RepID=UPI0038F6DC8B
MKEVWSKFLNYLNPASAFKKSESQNFNLKMMHGINRISILLFIICLIIMLFKFVL